MMTDYIEYLNLPTMAGIVIVALYGFLQLVGAILDFKGKAAPEFMNLRKYFRRKKRERETLANVEQLLEEVNSHYSADNIKMRDEWINGVNQKLKEHDSWRGEFDKKLDDNSAITLDILLENMRSNIINFASYVIDDKNPVTREQFNRIFKIYAKYEAILKENKMSNGEAVVAMRIINESYEHHMRHHSFIEDVRGYEPVMTAHEGG